MVWIYWRICITVQLWNVNLEVICADFHPLSNLCYVTDCAYDFPPLPFRNCMQSLHWKIKYVQQGCHCTRASASNGTQQQQCSISSSRGITGNALVNNLLSGVRTKKLSICGIWLTHQRSSKWRFCKIREHIIVLFCRSCYSRKQARTDTPKDLFRGHMVQKIWVNNFYHKSTAEPSRVSWK